jgi:hypothetical protein
MSGMMMKTDEAGVREESVISSAPNSFMLRSRVGATTCVNLFFPRGGQNQPSFRFNASFTNAGLPLPPMPFIT